MIPWRHAVDGVTVQQLRLFCLVFEKGCYAEAARAACLSVPAVWEQVRKLEARYQTSLFKRVGRGIQSTPAASLLYEELVPLLAGLHSTFEILDEEIGHVPRTVTIVGGARIIMEDLGGPLSQFHRRYPKIKVRLLHFSDEVASKQIVSGEADLALTIDPGPGIIGCDVSMERAYRIDYLAVFPRHHPLARKKELRLTDLADYPIIAGHSETYIRKMLEQGLHHEGLSRRVEIAVETDTSVFTAACVRAGIGVGIIAGRKEGFLCRDLNVRSLRSELGDAWVAFRWKAGRHLTPTVQELMRLIRESVEHPVQTVPLSGSRARTTVKRGSRNR